MFRWVRIQWSSRTSLDGASHRTRAWGSLTVTIGPPEAIEAGAQWRRVGTSTWHNSLFTESGVPAGTHTIEFKDISGWTKPPNDSVTLSTNENLLVPGAYTRRDVTECHATGIWDIADVQLIGQARTTITLESGSSVNGRLDYMLYEHDNPNAVHIPVVGIRDSSGQWVGGEPEPIDRLFTDCDGESRGNKAFGSIEVPTSPGTYGLWVFDAQAVSDSIAIQVFKDRSPTSNANQDKKFATLVVDDGEDDDDIDDSCSVVDTLPCATGPACGVLLLSLFHHMVSTRRRRQQAEDK